jgi:HAD superfamily hydrolase (TIGR01509 family)
MKKTIIFDVGGVIASPDRELFDRSVGEIRKGLCYKLFEDTRKKPENYGFWEKYSTGLISIEGFWTAMLREMNVNPSEENIRTINHALNTTVWKKVDYQVLDYIKEIKGKYPLVILSNSSPNEEKCAEESGLLSLFDEVFFSHKTGYRKPNPGAFLYVTSQLNVKPEDCLFIDDKVSNTIAAEGLGMDTHTYKKDISKLKEKVEQFLM